VLPRVDLDLPRGDFLGLVGPNGSGKTTILRAMLGLIAPLSGTVDRPVPDLRFGYVPQRKTLDDVWPLRTRDVVIMGLYHRMGLFRRPRAREREAALEALEAVGMGPFADHPFDALSGGQKQRTLIARALVTAPDILFLDEPTAGMDLPGAEAVLGLLRRLHRTGMTLVLVSHLLNEVVGTAVRVGLVGADGLHVGPTREVVTDAHLSRLYGVPVHVVPVDGRLLVLPGVTAEDRVGGDGAAGDGVAGEDHGVGGQDGSGGRGGAGR
jgi:manganese/zinc/iron transport system ATP- binding protein